MIFGWKKKRPSLTFKQRVQAFWNWFPGNGERIRALIDSQKHNELTSMVSKFMEETLPHMAWCFGPGERGGHSFTLSGEGIVVKQLLAENWLSQAVEVPGWTFHGSRQPTPPAELKGMAISFEKGVNIDVEHFLVKPQVDEKEERVNLVAWHPAFTKVPQDHRLQILYILLDEALGEFGVETWLGQIELEPFNAEGKTFSLDKLPEHLEQVKQYYHWEKLSPLRSYSFYEFSGNYAGPRGDTVMGTTCIQTVIGEFLSNQGKLEENPVEGTGAELAYLAIDGSIFPDGQQVDVRSNIEDALNDELQKEGSGRTLGGAFGSRNAYIDLLLLDGDRSRQLVADALKSLQLSHLARLETLA